MTLPDIAVRRPVLAAVASLLLLVFGLAALRTIPARALVFASRRAKKVGIVGKILYTAAYSSPASSNSSATSSGAAGEPGRADTP